MNQPMIVTGIGTRKINKPAFDMLLKIARRMAKNGWILRSGGAVGADTAWEMGWEGFDTKEIFLSSGNSLDIAKNAACGRTSSYGDIWVEAEDIASKLHPRWENLSVDAQALHTRNVFQVLGLDLRTKSDVVAAYAPPFGASVKGGTATAYNLARAKGIPTFNLWTIDGQRNFFAFVLERMGIRDERDITPSNGIIMSSFFEFE